MIPMLKRVQRMTVTVPDPVILWFKQLVVAGSVMNRMGIQRVVEIKKYII